MSDAAAAAGRRAAASYLRELLQRPGGYRRLWEQHVIRARSGEITQLAVAEVLARRLWSYPRVPGDVDVLPHQLKDTVSRALSGRQFDSAGRRRCHPFRILCPPARRRGGQP